MAACSVRLIATRAASSLNVAQQQDESRGAAIVDAARQAFDGWGASIWVGAGVMAVLFVFLLLLLRAPQTAPAQARPHVGPETDLRAAAPQ